jgi:hypothetical protein
MLGEFLPVGVDQDVGVQGDQRRPPMASRRESRSATSTPGWIFPLTLTQRNSRSGRFHGEGGVCDAPSSASTIRPTHLGGHTAGALRARSDSASKKAFWLSKPRILTTNTVGKERAVTLYVCTLSL